MTVQNVSADLETLLLRVGGPNLVRWHRDNTHDTDETSYLWLYRHVLLNGIQSTRTIYLDTNFWIRLRDAEITEHNGSTAIADAKALLASLRALTETRNVLCVGHASGFLELVKQSPQSLQVSARLFDQLSEGIVIAPPDDRRYWEAGDFVFNQLGLSLPTNVGYWSKIGQVLKSQFPDSFWEIPNGARQAVGKAVLDVLWNARLEDILAQFDWDPRTKLDFEIDQETIAQVEARKAQQIAGGKTRQTVREETFREHIITYYKPLFLRHLFKCNAVEGYGWNARSIIQRCNDLIEEAISRFRTDRLGVFLPMAALQSELYSLYEVDAGYGLTSNDWADWQHAAAALPHCDAFFTEAHLAHQLRNVLHADDRFTCTVASDIAEANVVLDQF